jgi:hypothetical protein
MVTLPPPPQKKPTHLTFQELRIFSEGWRVSPGAKVLFMRFEKKFEAFSHSKHFIFFLFEYFKFLVIKKLLMDLNADAD